MGWPGEKAGKCSRVGTNVRRPGSHRSTPSCLGALSAQALQPWRRLTSQWQTARASSCSSAAPATGPQAAVTCAHSLSRTKYTQISCMVPVQAWHIKAASRSQAIPGAAPQRNLQNGVSYLISCGLILRAAAQSQFNGLKCTLTTACA